MARSGWRMLSSMRSPTPALTRSSSRLTSPRRNSTLDEPFRVRFTQQDATRFDYWRRMEFTPEEWQGLVSHARERGLIFLSSAFSVAAVNLLRGIGMPAWKIGSGEFASADLWRAMAETGAPILFSTGMSKRGEIADAVAMFRGLGLPFALLQCTSAYPTPLEAVGLNVIEELRREFDCPVGLSDHSGRCFSRLGGAGARRKPARGPCHLPSPNVRSGRFRLDYLRRAEAVMPDARCAGHNGFYLVDNAMAEKLLEMRGIFGKSLAPICPLPAGTVLRPEMIVTKKPSGGIPLEAAGQITGRRLARDVVPERILRWDDLEEGS